MCFSRYFYSLHTKIILIKNQNKSSLRNIRHRHVTARLYNSSDPIHFGPNALHLWLCDLARRSQSTYRYYISGIDRR